MWIFDSAVRKGRIEIWGKENEGVQKTTHPLHPFFYLHLPDAHAYREMLEALEARYRAEECTFSTIFGPLEGFAIPAGRSIAEAIERETRYAAQLYNVDIRQDQRWMAEQNLVPCVYPDESRFAPDFFSPLTVMKMEIRGDPFRREEISGIDLGEGEVLTGRESRVLSDLFCRVEALDPDVLLLPDADLWVRQMLEKARNYELEVPLSRTGRFREMSARSYWSYGRVEYKGSALIPEGRILIDTARSFNYREGGLEGVLLASRLTGLAPNLAARLTAGTLISGYEVYEALKRGLAVPFRKSDPEEVRRCDTLRSSDRGGMMFQPVAGVYEQVHELDFTSLYPSIIVLHNLSPETLHTPGKRGFLPEVLEPLLSLRIRTKQMKKTDPAYAGQDGILKWMLVTCFGYTGYRNAKFGRIEVHELITGGARDILLRSKRCAEQMGFTVLHGIVDCLWVQGADVMALKERIEQETSLATECDTYDWIVFLPMNDGTGSYNRYFGKLSDTSLKLRGVMARRGDTPEYITRMQEEILDTMREACTRAELRTCEDRAQEIHARYRNELVHTDPAHLVIRRRISRSTYERNCLEAAAVAAYQREGIDLAPGMEVGYVVRDANTWDVTPPWDADSIDTRYYRTLLDKAWGEVAFVFDQVRDRPRKMSA
ncbi:MAG: type B DNA-directed DNA polymerase [Methanomicrobiales archaeon]|nr:type B DNA-directed DNA polymerase [Methanomicrobiales archaeon]